MKVKKTLRVRRDCNTSAKCSLQILLHIYTAPRKINNPLNLASRAIKDGYPPLVFGYVFKRMLPTSTWNIRFGVERRTDTEGRTSRISHTLVMGNKTWNHLPYLGLTRVFNFYYTIT